MLPVLVWNIEREIVSAGPFALRWYSLLFALGFILGYFMLRSMFRAEGKKEELLDSLLFYVVVGTVVGARLGHCLFYEPGEYLSNPLRILKIWEGGLASHGGYLGVMLALLLFCRKNKDIPFLWLTDRVAAPAMLAGGLIRIGNFFNSEIIGRPTDVSWAVVFQKIDQVPRHPAQLYEAVGYMTIAAIIYGAYRLTNRQPLAGRLFGLVMVLSFSFRLFIEVFKENQVSFENAMTLNMGQLLSIPFIVIGFALLAGVQRHIPALKALMEPRGDQTTQTADHTHTGNGTSKSRGGQRRKQKKKPR